MPTPDPSTPKGRLQIALAASGKTAYAVEKAAGLKKGHLSVILGRGGAMARDTAAAVARACGVSVGWLIAGEGPSPEQGAKQLTPPPLAPVPLDAALDAVFDSARHKVSDALAVREMLAGGLALSRPGEVEGLASALLDAAAELRERGAPVSRDTLLEALALRVASLRPLRAAG